MGTDLTYRELRRRVRVLAKDIRATTDAHRKTAARLQVEATDTGRIADQIATLYVDAATVAETREVSRIMHGVSAVALTYATAAEHAHRSAVAADQQATSDHAGIQEAVDRSPVRMADRAWYGQD